MWNIFEDACERLKLNTTHVAEKYIEALHWVEKIN